LAAGGPPVNACLDAANWGNLRAMLTLKTLIGWSLLVAVLIIPGVANAKLHTETVAYKDGDTPLEGYLAYDEGGPAKKPGILVVHDWMGVTAETKRRVDMLAGLGYVAFAADIYGKGVRPTDMKGAAAESGKWKAQRPLMRTRARAALDYLAGNKHVDPTRLVALGYCFGGTVALEVARSGAPVAGTVVFHGGLDTPTPADAKAIKGKVLALQGGDDPFVPAAQVEAFQKEMRDAAVDWQLVQYGGAVHAFTISNAGSDNSKGAAYNEKADKRSWEAMKNFLNELFPSSKKSG
jgi:dienelactone hydrolase